MIFQDSSENVKQDAIIHHNFIIQILLMCETGLKHIS